MATDYAKWNKIAYETKDDEMDSFTMAAKLLLQPPFVHNIEYYLENAPCPNIAHAHYWQMKEAGWDQQCIDYKLAQVVHYSKDATMFRDLEKKRIFNKLLEDKSETSKIESANVVKEEIQQSQLLEEHLFSAEHRQNLKRNLESNQGELGSFEQVDGKKKIDEMMKEDYS